MESGKTGYKDLLKQKDYLKLISANIVNRFGDSIDAIAYEWLVYLLTGSASWAALIFGINKIPTIFLQPIAGAAIEKMNKKNVMIVTDLIRGLCVAFIALSFYSGMLQPWMLIATTIIISSAEAFRMPCSSAVVVRVLSKETIDYGVSLSSSVGTVVEMVGLAVAAGIIATFGVSVAVGIDAATFFGSALIILTMNTHEVKSNETVVKGSYVKLLKEGGKYIVAKKLLFNFILLSVLCNAVFVPINSLQAPMVSEVLKSNAIMLSVFSLTVSAGMLIGSIVFPMIANKISGKKLIVTVGLILGLYHILLPLIGLTINNEFAKYIIVGTISIIVGFIFSLLSTYINATFYKIVERDYIARTGAIMNASGAAAVPIISFLVGIITVRFATNVIFFITGGVIIVLLLVMAIVYEEEDTSEEEVTTVDEMKEKTEIA